MGLRQPIEADAQEKLANTKQTPLWFFLLGGGHHCILLGVVFVCLVEVFLFVYFDLWFWFLEVFSGRRKVEREEGKILEKLGEEKECDHQNIH